MRAYAAFMGDLAVFRPPRSRWITAQICAGVVHFLALVLFLALLNRPAPGIYLLLPLGPSWALLGALRMTTRVELEDGGVRVFSGRSVRPRWTAWSDVVGVRVDPPGGKRHVRLALRDGGEVELPSLSDEGNGVVTNAYLASCG